MKNFYNEILNLFSKIGRISTFVVFWSVIIIMLCLTIFDGEFHLHINFSSGIKLYYSICNYLKN